MNRHEMLLVLILSVPRQIMNPKAGFLITAGSLSGIVDVSTAGLEVLLQQAAAHRLSGISA
jgi:hypothetical protein